VIFLGTSFCKELDAGVTFTPVHRLRRNEHIIAQLNLEQETPQYRSRTARLAKWKELMVTAQKQLELPAAVPESLQHLVSGCFKVEA